MGRRFIKITTIVFIVLAFGIGGFVFYQVYAPEVAYILDKPGEEEIEQVVKEFEEKVEVPEGNRLIIPAIGVDMEIGRDESFLDFGGWVQEVDVEGKPVLIGVHRFGWDTLSVEEKVRQTLYHAEKLREGDVVLVWWEGEKVRYEVKGAVDRMNKPLIGENELVVYTCKFRRSSERIWLNLVEIDYNL